jgi:RES domain-containing protein
MYLTLPAGTTLYRATDRNTRKPAVLAGLGAFYGRQYGGRYNASRQTTVYTASDPLVALTERTFSEALTWQDRLASWIRLPTLLISSL